eukprot:TRINITY_DN1709_c0_g1_i1.p2 TRINITY_DN1709_c0_g1~~TRINITY_DN1709_c0_g1_i1.p2  ORF type:complete len:201 (-),score=58.43 TRINITY_DN1709_c0_g1_i1:9-569(-)
MFRKFSPADGDVSVINQMKSSAQRGLRTKLLAAFPALEDFVEELMPKKDPLFLAKAANYVQLLVRNDCVLFFQERDGPWYPTLRVLHQYPDLLPRIGVDRGAIKFVLAGANIMCPGITSEGGSLPDEALEVDTVVAVYAEGKKNALAVGRLIMSTDAIKSENKGHGVANVHYLNDGMWKNGQDVKK